MLPQDNIYDESELHNDFINSLDNESLHNLDNAIEAMDVEIGGIKRRREQYGETSVKSEGKKERPTRRSGKWPPEKNDFQPTYIPEQYKYMGSKRRGFERAVQFQNSKSDGAILNLATHDPIDRPNIISIWKDLITVQKYIQNQYTIGT